MAVVALGLAALAGALSLGIGTPERPGSGTWPLLIGIGLVGLGIALALRFRQDSDAEAFTRNSAVVAAGLGTMIVFVAVIETIGFELPSLALMLVWLRFFGHESWRSTAIVSVGAVVAFYLIFVAALAVPIPHLF
nr:tripartite tricarboxylate transporter TctB family protein [Kineosporia babensis]